jgi:hypothetical protein
MSSEKIDYKEAASLMSYSARILAIRDPRQILGEIAEWEKRYNACEQQCGQLIQKGTPKNFHDMIKRYLAKMQEKSDSVFETLEGRLRKDLENLELFNVEDLQGCVEFFDAVQKWQSDANYLLGLYNDFKDESEISEMDEAVDEARVDVNNKLDENKKIYGKKVAQMSKVVQLRRAGPRVVLNNTGTPIPSQRKDQSGDEQGKMDIGGRKADAFFEYPSAGFEKPRPENKLQASNEKLRRVAELYLRKINGFIQELKATGENRVEIEALKVAYKDIKEKFDLISSGDAAERLAAMAGLGAKRNFADPLWESTVEVKVANQLKFSLNKLMGEIKHLNSNFLNKLDESFSRKLASEMQGMWSEVGRNPQAALRQFYDNFSRRITSLTDALEKVKVGNGRGAAETFEKIEADFYRFSTESKDYLQGLVSEKYSLVNPEMVNKARAILEKKFSKLEESVQAERYRLDLNIYVNNYCDTRLAELRKLVEELQGLNMRKGQDTEESIGLIKVDLKALRDEYLSFVSSQNFIRFEQHDPEGAKEINSALSNAIKLLINKVKAVAPKPDNQPAQFKSILTERKIHEVAESQKKLRLIRSLRPKKTHWILMIMLKSRGEVVI